MNESLSFGRVTTDAVHRRFRVKKNNNASGSNDKNQNDQDEFYCQQCNQTIPASPGKEELKTHFDTVTHKQYSSCVYCAKPVYIYKCKKELEVYHLCRYDK